MGERVVGIAKDVLSYAKSGEEPPYKESIVVLAEGVIELSDLLRWRDAWGEPPTEHGEYLVVRQNYGGDYSRTVGKWNGNWPAYLAVTYWRPIGPLPGGE